MGQVPGEAGLPSSNGAPQEGHQRGLTLCLVKFFVVFILKIDLCVYIRHTQVGPFSLFRALTRNGAFVKHC